nr:hypothetical protein [Rhizobium laguerreae]
MVGIFPNDDAIVRLVGALLLAQNDEWAVQRSRYITLETIATMSDDPLINLPLQVEPFPARPGKRDDPTSYTTSRDTIFLTACKLLFASFDALVPRIEEQLLLQLV